MMKQHTGGDSVDVNPVSDSQSIEQSSNDVSTLESHPQRASSQLVRRSSTAIIEDGNPVDNQSIEQSENDVDSHRQIETLQFTGRMRRKRVIPNLKIQVPCKFRKM